MPPLPILHHLHVIMRSLTGTGIISYCYFIDWFLGLYYYLIDWFIFFFGNFLCLKHFYKYVVFCGDKFIMNKPVWFGSIIRAKFNTTIFILILRKYISKVRNLSSYVISHLIYFNILKFISLYKKQIIFSNKQERTEYKTRF